MGEFAVPLVDAQNAPPKPTLGEVASVLANAQTVVDNSQQGASPFSESIGVVPTAQEQTIPGNTPGEGSQAQPVISAEKQQVSQTPESLIAPEQQRQTARKESRSTAARIVHIEDFRSANAPGALLELQFLRQISPKDMIRQKGQPVAFLPRPSESQAKLFITDDKGKKILVTVTDLNSVEQTPDGKKSIAVTYKQEFGKKSEDSFKTGEAVVSLDDLLEGAVYANADALRDYYKSDTSKEMVMDAYLVQLDEKMDPTNPKITEALDVGTDDKDILRIPGVTQAALAKARARREVFTEDNGNLQNLQEAVRIEAERAGMLTLDVIDSYALARVAILDTDEVRKDPGAKRAIEEEVKQIQRVSEQARQAGRTLLTAQDMVGVMHATLANPQDRNAIKQQLDKLPGDIKSLEYQYVQGKDPSGVDLNPAQRRQMRDGIDQLHEMQANMQAVMNSYENPTQAEAPVQQIFTALENGSLTKNDALSIQSDFRSGNMGDIIKHMDRAMEHIVPRLKGERDERSRALSQKWLEVRRESQRAMRGVGKGANIMLILLMLSTLGASGLAHAQ